MQQGGSFEWTDEGKTGTGTIKAVEPMKRLEILTQMGNDRDSHVFKLRPSGGFFGLQDDECKVEYSLDTLMGGDLLGSFVASGNPKDALRVKRPTNQFRGLVESL